MFRVFLVSNPLVLGIVWGVSTSAATGSLVFVSQLSQWQALWGVNGLGPVRAEICLYLIPLVVPSVKQALAQALQV